MPNDDKRVRELTADRERLLETVERLTRENERLAQRIDELRTLLRPPLTTTNANETK